MFIDKDEVIVIGTCNGALPIETFYSRARLICAEDGLNLQMTT